MVTPARRCLTSHGTIRLLEVQSENQAAGTASIDDIVDRTDVSDKIPTAPGPRGPAGGRPPAGGQRLEVSDLTVLGGTGSAGTGSASGSAGPSVPGQ